MVRSYENAGNNLIDIGRTCHTGGRICGGNLGGGGMELS